PVNSGPKLQEPLTPLRRSVPAPAAKDWKFLSSKVYSILIGLSSIPSSSSANQRTKISVPIPAIRSELLIGEFGLLEFVASIFVILGGVPGSKEISNLSRPRIPALLEICPDSSLIHA